MIRGSYRPPRRRGVLTLALAFFLLILILAAALAINWTYLVTVQQDTESRTDLIALGSVSGLLDPRVLMDLPGNPDLLADQVIPRVEKLRLANNAAGPAVFAIEMEDLNVTPGRVADVTAEVTAANFTNAMPYNALKIEAHRQNNPVAHLVNGFWNANPVSVGAASYAVLDNQVQGFCPTSSAAAPVVPMAIDEAAWAARVTGPAGLDTDGNGIKELVLRLESTTGSPPSANAAFLDTRDISIDLANGADRMRILNQIAGGLTPSDLPPGGKLGPATPDAVPQYKLPATQQLSGQAETDQMAAALAAVDAGPQPCRAFPLYRTIGSGEAHLVGFVAARIVSADDEEPSTSEQRLRVIVEPCYLVHSTVWTDPSVSQRNALIHKVRLLQ